MNCTVAQSRRFHMSRSSYNLDLTGTVEQSRRFHMSQSSYNLDLTGTVAQSRRFHMSQSSYNLDLTGTVEQSRRFHMSQSSYNLDLTQAQWNSLDASTCPGRAITSTSQGSAAAREDESKLNLPLWRCAQSAQHSTAQHSTARNHPRAK
jgi:hypothetical protein